MEITIRKAVQADIPALLRLLKYIAALHHAGRPDIFRSGSSKYDETALADILQDEKKPVFVAASGSQILGYVFCVHREWHGDPMLQDRTALYIDDLCVDERERGCGLGRKLLDAVRAYAVQSGIGSLELNVWGFNQPAAAFYEHFGFTVQKSILELRLP